MNVSFFLRWRSEEFYRNREHKFTLSYAELEYYVNDKIIVTVFGNLHCI
jgi:hypothetical protein